jgi:hypothetical protein
VEVELSLGVVPPGEALLVSDDPIEGETEGCQEEDAGQDHDQGVLQPAPAAPFVLLLVVPVSERDKSIGESKYDLFIGQVRDREWRVFNTHRFETLQIELSIDRLCCFRECDGSKSISPTDSITKQTNWVLR